MSEKNRLNITFSIVRVFAILSIVSAHIKIYDPSWIGAMINTFAFFGVNMFMVLSGYFYHSNKYKNILQMLGSKIKSIFIPWFFWGSLYYIWRIISGGGTFSLVGLFSYILGYKTFLYYLTMLVLCYIIFFRRNKMVIYSSMIISIISIFLTDAGMLDRVINTLNLTKYLNIFNWVGWFAIGYILQEVKSDKIYNFLIKTKSFSITTFVVSYILIFIFGSNEYISLPFKLISIWAFMSISTFEILNKDIVHQISNMTFGVYLIHMLSIGPIMAICNKTNFTKLGGPVIVTIICLFVLWIGFKTAKLIKADGVYCVITGIRGNRSIK